MSMRLKLFLSFLLIILITVISVVLIVRRNTVEEVRQYMFRGGMMGLSNMVIDLSQKFLKHLQIHHNNHYHYYSLYTRKSCQRLHH